MHAIWHALSITGSMAWEIAWALILGFTLSAMVQAVVRKTTVVSLLDKRFQQFRTAITGR